MDVGKFIIVNKIQPNQKIGHYLLIIQSDDIVELFDSLGAKPSDINKIEKFGPTVQFNSKPVQGTDSTFCGQFCLFVAFNRLLDFDLTLSEVLSDLFSANLQDNDKLVQNFYEKYA